MPGRRDSITGRDAGTAAHYRRRDSGDAVLRQSADRRPVNNYQGTCQASFNSDYGVMLS